MSVGIWRQDDREDRTPSRSFKQKFALMLTHYPVGHEQTQSGARLFGGEVRFEKMVAIVVGDAWPVVRYAEEGPSVVAPAGCQLNMSVRRRGVNRKIVGCGRRGARARGSSELRAFLAPAWKERRAARV